MRLFLKDGHAYSGMGAIICIGARLGGVGRLLGAIRIFPRAAREWIYRRIARNRFLGLVVILLLALLGLLAVFVRNR